MTGSHKSMCVRAFVREHALTSSMAPDIQPGRVIAGIKRTTQNCQGRDRIPVTKQKMCCHQVWKRREKEENRISCLVPECDCRLQSTKTRVWNILIKYNES